MALVRINKHPSPRDLRAFGLGLPIFSAVIAAVLYYRHRDAGLSLTVFAAMALLAAAYFAMPRTQRPIYFGWVYLTFPIGWLVSHLVMAWLFYGVVTPIALLLRLTGRDALKLRFDRNARSYWSPHDPSDDIERYFRPF